MEGTLMSVKYYNPSSSGEVYEVKNVPLDYKHEKLNRVFNKMNNEITPNAYSYGSEEIAAGESKREFNHIYQVFYLSEGVKLTEKTIPHEYCLIRSDSTIKEEELIKKSMPYFMHIEKRLDLGKVEMFTSKLK